MNYQQDFDKIESDLYDRVKNVSQDIFEVAKQDGFITGEPVYKAEHIADFAKKLLNDASLGTFTPAPSGYVSKYGGEGMMPTEPVDFYRVAAYAMGRCYVTQIPAIAVVPIDLGNDVWANLAVHPRDNSVMIFDSQSGMLVGRSIVEVRNDIGRATPEQIQENVQKQLENVDNGREVDEEEFWRRVS